MLNISTCYCCSYMYSPKQYSRTGPIFESSGKITHKSVVVQLPLNVMPCYTLYKHCTRLTYEPPHHKASGVMGGSRGGQRVRTPPPLKNHKNKGFLSNTGPDRLKHHKATKPALIVGPSSARQRNVSPADW